MPDDPGQPDMGSGFAWTNLHRLLAGFVPALSLPVGANKADKIERVTHQVRNVNLQGYVDSNWWAEVRLRGEWEDAWLHSDIRIVAYPYVHAAFDEMVEEGGLKE